MKNLFVVDSKYGPYKLIQEAIDAATPGSQIKIAKGVYNENITITKDGLKLQPREQMGDIILVASKNPCIYIDLKKGQKFCVEGLKIAHCGNNDGNTQLQNFFTDNSNPIQEQGKKKDQHHKREMDPNILNFQNIDNIKNCALFINGGKVIIKDCLITLGFLMKNHTNPLYGIVADEGTQLECIRCEIQGNAIKETQGLFLKWADVKIQSCGVYSHLLGGLQILSHKYNIVEIFNSKFDRNSVSGISCFGDESEPKIYQNLIENNKGVGILVGTSNQAKIYRNTIKLNNTGIECQSSNPLIKHNKIWKNNGNGINTKCIYEYRQNGIIKQNEISCNGENGVFCEGQYNFTKISQNPFIGFNKKAGIIADNQAQITIYGNLISRNFQQGILLVESSSAKIEKNRILYNLKAGIALGGFNSVETIIINNYIYGGSREGIYIIDSGQIWIIRNQIDSNQEGIVLTNSIPLIENNDIMNNKGNGILCLKKSRPQILKNIILDNDGIGLFLKDKFQGEIVNNKIYNNEIDLILEKYSKNQQQILLQNKLDDNNRLPQKLKCLIQ